MSSFKPIKKALFPVAGLGTRFLPATKDTPKEMLPLIDRPLIHHGVDEAVSSGCTDIIFVTGNGKESIRKYFQHSSKLEEHLAASGKSELADIISLIPDMAKFHYALQRRPLGLGNAVLCAEKFCCDSYFGLLLPDDVMLAEPPVLTQLDAVRKKYGGSVLSLEKVDHGDTSRYGIVDADEIEPGVFKINGLVEKPDPDDAPSDMAIMGRYVLSPSIFGHLKKLKPGKGGEYQLTDGIASLLRSEDVYGCAYSGKRLDCGVRAGWIKATIVKALQDPELKKIIVDTLREEKVI